MEGAGSKTSTGDFYALGVHPAQVIAKQRGDGIANIIRQPHSSERRLRGNMLIHLRVILTTPPPKSVSIAPGAILTEIPRSPSSFAW